MSGSRSITKQLASATIGLIATWSMGCSVTGKKCGCTNGCHGESCIPHTASEVPANAEVNHVERCVDLLPCSSIPAPTGTYLGQWRGAMADQAQQQHWVITRNEWFDGGNQLGPEGRTHVVRIAQCMTMEPNFVIIESEPLAIAPRQTYEAALLENQQLQNERRTVVIQALAEAGVMNAEEWVVFGEDRSVGVHGIEAPIIFNRQFNGGGVGNRGGLGRGIGNGGGFGGGFGGLGGFGGGGFGGGFGGGGNIGGIF